MTNWYTTVNRFRDPVRAARFAAFIDILDRFPVGHLVDLGAGHGMFSRVAAGLGWRVTAVDARPGRFPNDADVRWVVADVRDFDEYDDVDVVANLGLWYHLAASDQRALAAKIAPRPMILDTHVALAEQPEPYRDRCGPLVMCDGLTGRLFDESDIQHRSTASFGNLASFWPTTASLHQQMYDAGYDVFETYEPAYLPDRAFFIARSLNYSKPARDLDTQVMQVEPMDRPDASPTDIVLWSLTDQLPTDVVHAT